MLKLGCLVYCIILQSAVLCSADLPQSGFIRVTTIDSGLTLVLRLAKRVRGRPICSEARLTNAPADPAQSPLMGPPLFRLMTESSSSSRATLSENGDADFTTTPCSDIRYFNGRPAWTNGKEVISFVPSDGKGTWILGTDPGVDSGYAYMKPSTESLSPHSGAAADQWQWLIKNEWLPREDVSFECISHARADDAFECPAVDSADVHFYVVERFDSVSQSFSESYYLPEASLLWNQDTSAWAPVGRPEIVCAFGEPLQLFIDPGSGLPSSDPSHPSIVAHALNQEQGSGGFKVILRRSDMSITPQQQQQEYTIELGPASSLPFHRLPPDGLAEHVKSAEHALAAARPGDWLWLWRGSEEGEEQAVSDVLLQCVEYIESSSVNIFRYFDSDRIATMHRSVLNRETHFYSLAPLTNSSISERAYSLTSGDGSAVPVVTVFSTPTFGAGIVSFLTRHLAQKEGTLGKLPSCFLYHAAVSMPAQLVYAAELLCVALGAKPVAMVQYSTPSDHQWKFPLVSEISSLIARLKIALPDDALSVDYIVTKYQSDETLVVFQKSKRALAASLQPFGQAQALHPLPYPENEHSDRDHKLQIYYAWWNGYILGYPEHFIDSYCLSFHNDLPEPDRREQMARARVDVTAHLRSHGISRAIIGRSDSAALPPDNELWRHLLLL